LRNTLNALTLLHELGHAINDISGWMTSGIMPDGTAVYAGGTFLSMANIANTAQHCLRK